jgi:hypothetical protein
MAIDKKHWKEHQLNENFQAEIGGRGISEFQYGGCIGTWRGDNKEAKVHSKGDGAASSPKGNVSLLYITAVRY